MRKIRDVLRLKFEAGLSDRKIAAAIGSSRSTVQECLKRARAAQLGWPLSAELDDAALLARLYRRAGPVTTMPLPDFPHIFRELSRVGVTRQLLWEEYKAAHPEGLQYTAFCVRYRHWLGRQELVLRQAHVPGDKLFVDYAGPTVPITDRHTGEQHPAQIFVAVLGASNYTYAEATASQRVPEWLGSHVRALQYFGGSPRAIVPDNLKSGVLRAHRYEPDINPAYQDFAEHYGVAILPARVRKPRDKAKVEAGVLVVERWILARLRDRTFFSLEELNGEIRVLLERLNTRSFKKLPGSRRSHFLGREQAALKPLPPRPYEFAEWRVAKVHADYHIEVGRAYYSVPYALIGERVDVRLTERAVEIFHHRALVASHARAIHRAQRSTRDGHRPTSHVEIIERSLNRVLERAHAIGPATHAVLAAQSARRKHPEEVLRSAQGILRLAGDFSAADLERACARALALRSYSYRAVRGFIENPQAPAACAALDLAHENVRGPEYFQ